MIKNGRVVHQVRLADYAKMGGQLPEVEFKQSGWLLVRAVTTNPRTYRFASTGPYYVEIGESRRISKSAASFFLDWVNERIEMLQLEDPLKREEVLQYHRAARNYWQKVVDGSNVD